MVGAVHRPERHLAAGLTQRLGQHLTLPVRHQAVRRFVDQHELAAYVTGLAARACSSSYPGAPPGNVVNGLGYSLPGGAGGNAYESREPSSETAYQSTTTATPLSSPSTPSAPSRSAPPGTSGPTRPARAASWPPAAPQT